VGSYKPMDGAVVHCLNNAPRATLAATQPGPAAPTLAPVSSSGDPFQTMMAQGHQMMQNPQMMQQLMSLPMVQQMMSNPETVRAMLRMNPQLSRLMEERPEIARLLDDPEVVQQAMRMATNPSLMREMTRNADRAIGQLDAMPGGRDALLQAHADVADPLYEALSGGSGDPPTGDVATYTQPTEGGPNSAALPNPWGTPVAAPAVPMPAMPTPAAMPATMPAGGAAPGQGANMDHLTAMMQQMFANPAVAPTAPAATVQPQAPQANPMVAMMQQMMSDPAHMQQMMALSHQMMTSQAPATTTAQATGPFAPAALGGLQPNLQPGVQQAPAFNPMAATMQQMVQNPAQMQSMMALSQQLMGGSGALPSVAPTTPVPAPETPAVTGAPLAAAVPVPAPGAAAPDTASAAILAQQRVRFASQLSQLVAMGFTNPAACLRALAQHGGRVDAAIDTLLSSSPDASN